MPFLRFTRDKRGYETTSLVHADRRGGRSRQHILYWFRTPPGVKVGRPALDEEAIRRIEEQNPDIEFNWPKILEARAPDAPADEMRPRRGRRDKPQPRRPPRPPAPAQTDAPPPVPVTVTPAELSEVPVVPESTADLREADLNNEDVAEPMDAEAIDAESTGEEEVVEAFEQLTHPETEEKVEPAPMPVEGALGREQLTRLRARFAELQARITERGGDPARIEALRAQAEPLNPDAWVTGEEVRRGIESFEPKIRDLRQALGLRRRRRSRRGGRRRHGGSGGGTPPAGTPPESSNNEE